MRPKFWMPLVIILAALAVMAVVCPRLDPPSPPGPAVDSARKDQEILSLKLVRAVRDENAKKVGKLLLKKASPETVDMMDNPVLSLAARNAKTTVMKALLAHGANPNQADTRGNTPLMKAVDWEDLDMVKLLVKKGAEPRAANILNQTALEWANAQGSLEVADYLFRLDPVNNLLDLGGRCLHRAASDGSLEMVNLWLTQGVNPDAPDPQGNTPLHKAILAGHHDVARRLIESGADLALANQYGTTPAGMAFRRKDWDMAKTLAGRLEQSSSPVNQLHARIILALAEPGDHPALDLIRPVLESGAAGSLACQFLILGSYDARDRVIRQLLDDSGRDFFSPPCRTATLMAASAQGHTRTMKLLLDYGVQVNSQDPDGDTPLAAAAFWGQEAALEMLLESGALVDQANQYGQTPLMLAARKNHHRMLERLLAAGADPNLADESGETALFKALYWEGPPGRALFKEKDPEDNARSVRALIRAGAHIRARLPCGCSPLHAAAEKGHEEAARLLIEAGAGLNVRENNGRTPLVMALVEDQYRLARVLLDAGADPDLADAKGRSALFWIAEAEYWEMDEAEGLLEEVLANMDNPWSTDRFGLSALDYAQTLGYKKAKRRLKEIQARQAVGRITYKACAFCGLAVDRP